MNQSQYKYSRHIFITNHMNTIQYKQVASVLTSCCPPRHTHQQANHIFITNHMNAHHKFSIKA